MAGAVHLFGLRPNHANYHFCLSSGSFLSWQSSMANRCFLHSRNDYFLSLCEMVKRLAYQYLMFPTKTIILGVMYFR